MKALAINGLSENKGRGCVLFALRCRRRALDKVWFNFTCFWS